MKKIILIIVIAFSLFLQFSCSKKKEDTKSVEIVKESVMEKVQKSAPQKSLQSIPKKEKTIVIEKDDPQKGGVLFAKIDNGQKLILPLKKTDVDIDFSSGIVQANVTQTYTNDTNYTLEAIYIFPLPSNATVPEMKLRVGNRIISSEVQEKQAAKQTYKNFSFGFKRIRCRYRLFR